MKATSIEGLKLIIKNRPFGLDENLIANYFFRSFRISVMRINNYSQINFNAKFLNNVTIQKLNPKTNNYIPTTASFVEFEPQNAKDFEAIKNAVTNWEGQVFATSIGTNAENIIKGTISNKINRIFMLTTQKDNFEKLDKEKVLGLANMEQLPNKPNELRYFQVKPDSKFGTNNRKFRHVGKEMLKSIQHIYKKGQLMASYSAANFYARMGLELIDANMLVYSWHKLIQK